MAGSSRCRGKRHSFQHWVAVAACALAVSACAGESYQVAAMEASDGGNQKAAIGLARKEVARFAGPDQCSRTNALNCGTLALAYGTLASYQILDRDRTGGEASFRSAREALTLTAPANRSSATAMVYRDVSEAYWKIGDRTRAIDVFKEGRTAGADQYLYMTSAARALDPPPANPQSVSPQSVSPPPASPPPANPPQAEPEGPNLQRTVRHWGAGATPQ